MNLLYGNFSTHCSVGHSNRFQILRRQVDDMQMRREGLSRLPRRASELGWPSLGRIPPKNTPPVNEPQIHTNPHQPRKGKYFC